MTGLEPKAAMAAVLLAFGIAVPLPTFLAGMFLALSGAYFAMMVSKPDRPSFWLTLSLGAFFGLVAGIVHSSNFPTWSAQLMMGIGGALSRYLAALLVSFGRAIQDRGSTLADKVLPDQKKGKDDA
jgi:hydrogenase/urease accessory protein HupE